MDIMSFVWAFVGGVLLGFAALGLMLFNGRIAGISGILNGVFTASQGEERSWRACFVGGLLAGGLVLLWWLPGAFPSSLAFSWPWYIAAGLLVGFGTQLGSGCTSGHGICGISRFSPRSLVATVTFIATGALTVFALRMMGGV